MARYLVTIHFTNGRQKHGYVQASSPPELTAGVRFLSFTDSDSGEYVRAVFDNVNFITVAEAVK